MTDGNIALGRELTRQAQAHMSEAIELLRQIEQEWRLLDGTTNWTSGAGSAFAVLIDEYAGESAGISQVAVAVESDLWAAIDVVEGLWIY